MPKSREGVQTGSLCITTMEDEPTNTPEKEEDRTDMTVVILGETAVWITVWEYYVRYNT